MKKYITDILTNKIAGMTIEDIRADYTEAQKKRIIDYFKRFDAVAFTSQPVFDAFTGQKVAAADNSYTDGIYTWYRSEMYYFEHYGLRLRKDFIEHVMRTVPQVTAK